MYRAVFANRDFALYFFAKTISGIGSSLSTMAFVLLVYHETHSPSKTTGVILAETLPYLFFGLPGGVVADWVQRRAMLVRLDVLQGLIMLAAGALYGMHALPYAAILAAVFLVETVGCFYGPASRSMLPNLVDRTHWVVANSLVDISVRGSQLAGPALTYFLLKWIGFMPFFLADGASYFVSAAALWRIAGAILARSEARTREQVRTVAVFQAVARFAAFAWREADLRWLLISTASVVFFNTWVWQVGLLVRAQHLFRNGDQMYSLFMIGFTAMTIAVSLLLPLWMKRFTVAHYMAGAALWGAGVAGVGIVRGAVPLELCALLVGVGMPLAGQSRLFLLQDRVPEEMRGRAFSMSSVLLYFSNVASLAVFSQVSRFVSVPALFVTLGCLMAGVAGVYAVASKVPPLRRRHPVHAPE